MMICRKRPAIGKCALTGQARNHPCRRQSSGACSRRAAGEGAQGASHSHHHHCCRRRSQYTRHCCCCCCRSRSRQNCPSSPSCCPRTKEEGVRAWSRRRVGEGEGEARGGRRPSCSRPGLWWRIARVFIIMRYVSKRCTMHNAHYNHTGENERSSSAHTRIRDCAHAAIRSRAVHSRAHSHAN